MPRLESSTACSSGGRWSLLTAVLFLVQVLAIADGVAGQKTFERPDDAAGAR